MRIAAADGTRRHFLGDLVGTTEMTLKDDGTKSKECIRDAWGIVLAEDTNGDGLGFAQREHDMESGLVYMRHRMYDPRIGRFTQMDPVLENRPPKHYLYGSNNPITRTDPFGLDDDPDFWDWISPTYWARKALNKAERWATNTHNPAVAAVGGFVAGLGQEAVGAARKYELVGGTKDRIESTIQIYRAQRQAGAGPLTAALRSGAIQIYENIPCLPTVTDLAMDTNTGALARTNDARLLDGWEKAERYIIVGTGLAGLGAGAGSRGSNLGGRGGLAPVLKGQAGVDKFIEYLRAQGVEELTTEVTVKTKSVRVRLDIVAETDESGLLLFDSKNGPKAGLNANQAIGYPELSSSGGVIRTGKLEKFGLRRGDAIGPTPVYVVRPDPRNPGQFIFEKPEP